MLVFGFNLAYACVYTLHVFTVLSGILYDGAHECTISFPRSENPSYGDRPSAEIHTYIHTYNLGLTLTV